MNVFKINPEQPSDDNDWGTKVEGYTNGVDDSVDFPASPGIDPESPDCYAKRITICGEGGTRYKHYIKMGTHGYIYNPWGMYSEGTQHKEAKHLGKKVWSFRPVSVKAFTYYLDFLRTQNPAWLTNAERETRNG